MICLTVSKVSQVPEYKDAVRLKMRRPGPPALYCSVSFSIAHHINQIRSHPPPPVPASPSLRPAPRSLLRCLYPCSPKTLFAATTAALPRSHVMIRLFSTSFRHRGRHGWGFFCDNTHASSCSKLQAWSRMLRQVAVSEHGPRASHGRQAIRSHPGSIMDY